MSYILQTFDLSKTYGKKTVVDKINIHLQQGEIYGFIGQNGAGKTTAIRMILNLTSKTEGEAILFGEPSNDKNIYRHLRKIGAIIEAPGFYLNLTAKENLDIHRMMMNIEDKHSIESVMELVGLQGEEHKRVSHYSLGMKQRLGLARALLHDPDLLILDEPTNGLDPQGIAEIRSLMLSLARRGKTIFLSSHILAEVEKIVSRIGILHKGKLLEEISKQDFENNSRTFLSIKTDRPGESMAFLKHNGINDLTISNEKCIVFQIDDTARAQHITRMLVENGQNVLESKLMYDTLEDYFMRKTEGERI
jgi:bacitracin transport system ATP-binding protein